MRSETLEMSAIPSPLAEKVAAGGRTPEHAANFFRHLLTEEVWGRAEWAQSAAPYPSANSVPLSAATFSSKRRRNFACHLIESLHFYTFKPLTINH